MIKSYRPRTTLEMDRTLNIVLSLEGTKILAYHSKTNYLLANFYDDTTFLRMFKLRAWPKNIFYMPFLKK